ncbi:group III truncated hemoglobin [uncultured Arcticibacterium sp.]|uniref:group III truncated hemoglobin n=1 Tax=uncultured Arcticibacterium sp. TaxID=2173042 RepID=UPI0030F6A8F1
MKEIENRTDIINLVNKFYEYVHADPKMAPVFVMPPEQWERHLERTYNFWDNWLFQTGSYKGGLMWAHIEKNQSHPITTELFEHWLSHWFRTVDELFTGEKAEFLKSKALELGQIMNAKLNRQ